MQSHKSSWREKEREGGRKKWQEKKLPLFVEMHPARSEKCAAGARTKNRTDECERAKDVQVD